MIKSNKIHKICLYKNTVYTSIDKDNLHSLIAIIDIVLLDKYI